MSAFSLDADAIIEILAALIMLACVALALRAGVNKRPFAATLWLLVAALACAVLIFFLTFRIRLM